MSIIDSKIEPGISPDGKIQVLLTGIYILANQTAFKDVAGPKVSIYGIDKTGETLIKEISYSIKSGFTLDDNKHFSHYTTFSLEKFYSAYKVEMNFETILCQLTRKHIEKQSVDSLTSITLGQ